MELYNIRDMLSCSQDERQEIAADLAKDRPLDELMNIVETGVKRTLPASWTNLWQGEKEYYDLEEQLLAVEALAETGSPKALSLLERIYTPTVTNEHKRIGNSGMYDDYEVEVNSYPDAGGPLQGELNYTRHLTEVRYGSFGSSEQPVDYGNDPDCIARGIRAHRVIRAAIAKLKGE